MNNPELKELLDMARDIEPSRALSQELVLLAFEAGKKQAKKDDVPVNSTLDLGEYLVDRNGR